ncbi:hypothetical protein B0G75_11564 [Paraburkholderia sp. BL18I3N2]|nr:hypothetical protein B0G75_11564 [Paraburkholderia sp. BL18I3N2]
MTPSLLAWQQRQVVVYGQTNCGAAIYHCFCALLHSRAPCLHWTHNRLTPIFTRQTPPRGCPCSPRKSILTGKKPLEPYCARCITAHPHLPNFDQLTQHLTDLRRRSSKLLCQLGGRIRTRHLHRAQHHPDPQFHRFPLGAEHRRSTARQTSNMRNSNRPLDAQPLRDDLKQRFCRFRARVRLLTPDTSHLHDGLKLSASCASVSRKISGNLTQYLTSLAYNLLAD